MFNNRKKISFVMAGILTFVALFGSVSLNAIDVEAANDDRAVFSILGDSLSAYYGLAPYNPYYGPEGSGCEYIMPLSDMWFSKYANENGLKIGKVNGIGMSRVTTPDYDGSSFNSSTRIDSLDDNGVPDVIAVLGGLNDLSIGICDVPTFSERYRDLVNKLHNKYPGAMLILIAPFHLQNGIDGYDNTLIDGYGEAIRQVAVSRGDLFVDLKTINFQQSDFDKYNSIHLNETGQRKVVDKLNGVVNRDIITSISSEVTYDSYMFSVKAFGKNYENYRYRITIVNDDTGVETPFEWQDGNSFKWTNINGDCHYSIKAELDSDNDGTADAVYDYVLGKPSLKKEDAGVWIYKHEYNNIIAGLVTSVDNVNNFDYQWLGYDCSQGKWFVISDWAQGNQWLSWNPGKTGDFLLYGRIKPHNSNIIIGDSCVGFHHKQFINNICQVPYSGQGGGYLIGFSTFDNPNNSYRYEMLVLDCSLLAAGYPYPWIHSTGKINAGGGNTAWTIWQPQHGYYWTLFRVYDESGNVLDQECYGFANV